MDEGRRTILGGRAEGRVVFELIAPPAPPSPIRDVVAQISIARRTPPVYSLALGNLGGSLGLGASWKMLLGGSSHHLSFRYQGGTDVEMSGVPDAEREW
jgi:hypothetical protein